MAAVELVDDAEAARAIRVHRELVRCGYVLARRPGLRVLRIDPALTIERDDLEGLMAAFEDVLTTAAG
jgi:4-aminobutyrate aminotransferase-like enzyme